jgi:hypothetical protein
VVTWADVERVALTLPGAASGEAHEGSAAVLVGPRQFARLRWDGPAGQSAQVLQVWLPDQDLVPTYVADDPGQRWGAPGFSRYVLMVRLSSLDEPGLRELLVESWAARAPARLVNTHPDLR